MANLLLVLLLGCLFEWSVSIDTKYMYESCNSSSSLDKSFQLETSKSLSYPFRIDCSFSVTAPVGSRILAVITRFELEEKVNGKCADYLNIHDGVVKSASLLNPSPVCGSSVSKTFNSSGSSMTFHFHSDRSAAYRGFSIILTAFQNDPCTSSQFSCNNGVCIDPTLKCDDYNQCGDNSDESSCEVSTPAASAGSSGMALVLGIVIGVIIIAVIAGAIVLHVYKKNQWKNFLHQQLEDPDVWNSSPSYPVTKKYYRNGRGNYNTLNNETTEESSNGACARDEST